MARVLVIGGTLFIGRALVEQLLARGDDVVIMHRGKGHPFGPRVSEIQCDRNDIAAVRRALAGTHFDVVYDNVYDWQHGTSAEQVIAAAPLVADEAAPRRLQPGGGRAGGHRRRRVHLRQDGDGGVAALDDAQRELRLPPAGRR